MGIGVLIIIAIVVTLAWPDDKCGCKWCLRCRKVIGGSYVGRTRPLYATRRSVLHRLEKKA